MFTIVAVVKTERKTSKAFQFASFTQCHVSLKISETKLWVNCKLEHLLLMLPCISMFNATPFKLYRDVIVLQEALKIVFDQVDLVRPLLPKTDLFVRPI